LVFVKPKGGKVDLRALLKVLGGMGMMHILVEGGGELVAGLVEEGLADRFLFFIAPKIIGGRAAPTAVEGKGAASLVMAPVLKNINVKRFADDILIEGEAERCSRA
jgi:diaminohydroxyphosphoribosylaminopyrimidine deaminase/5-amino-6-(5-phosphoribosylamino)uracil reductase